MKNIIIPVDFSAQSEYALHTGAILAKKHNATLYVLHMLELSDSLVNQSENQMKNEMFFMFALAKKNFEYFLEKDYLEGIITEYILDFLLSNNLHDSISGKAIIELPINYIMKSLGYNGIIGDDSYTNGWNKGCIYYDFDEAGVLSGQTSLF